MNERTVVRLFGIYLTLLLACVSGSWAGACDSIVLPKVVAQSLRKDYAGWRVVTPGLLSSSDDRQIWCTNYRSECPGIIQGRFTSRRTEYVLNLIKGKGKTLEQQIVLFEPRKTNVRRIVLDPPSHVDVITVIRKFAPGRYQDPDSGRSIEIPLDTIGVSEIEAGTEVYYWNGKRFDQITTSE